MTRKAIPEEVQARILAECRRRCALCFGLNRDSARKEGQLAHINRDSADNRLENLCFLCLQHHNEYDSKPSQSKGINPRELRKYFIELHNFLKTSWIDHQSDAPGPTQSPGLTFNISIAGGAGGAGGTFGSGGGGGGAFGSGGQGGGESGNGPR